MITIERCLCCIGLRTATLVTAFYGILSFILSSINMLCIVLNYSKIIEHLRPNFPKLTKYLIAHEDYVFILMAIGLCIAFLNCLGSGFLICGINENNDQKMRPFLFINAFAIICGFTLLLVFLCLSHVDGLVLLLVIPSITIFFVFEMYIWLVVYSYYKRVQQGDYGATYNVNN